MEYEEIGKVIISPQVLSTIARLTALATPGVAGLAVPGLVERLLGAGTPPGGVRVKVKDGAVSVDLYIIAEQDAKMFELGQALQKEITRAIEHIVGMEVKEVNVYIQGVKRGE